MCVLGSRGHWKIVFLVCELEHGLIRQRPDLYENRKLFVWISKTSNRQHEKQTNCKRHLICLFVCQTNTSQWCSASWRPGLNRVCVEVGSGTLGSWPRWELWRVKYVWCSACGHVLATRLEKGNRRMHGNTIAAPCDSFVFVDVVHAWTTCGPLVDYF